MIGWKQGMCLWQAELSKGWPGFREQTPDDCTYLALDRKCTVLSRRKFYSLSKSEMVVFMQWRQLWNVLSVLTFILIMNQDFWNGEKSPLISSRENNILFLTSDSLPATCCSLKRYHQGCCLKYHLESLCSQGFRLLPRLAWSPHMEALPAFFQSISSISLWSLDSSPQPKTQISIPLLLSLFG